MYAQNKGSNDRPMHDDLPSDDEISDLVVSSEFWMTLCMFSDTLLRLYLTQRPCAIRPIAIQAFASLIQAKIH